MSKTSETKMSWGQLLRLEWKHGQEAKIYEQLQTIAIVQKQTIAISTAFKEKSNIREYGSQTTSHNFCLSKKV
jgi:hypothetical protein